MIKNIGSKIKALGEIYSLIIAILSGMAGGALSEAFDNYWFLLIIIIIPNRTDVGICFGDTETGEYP